MLNIIITLDYEIFGNGTGDPKRHMIDPTEKILNICNEHKVPLTIMFEVNEYLKFQKYDESLKRNLGYSPSELIKKQTQEAVRRGHDVQLHLHPQWIDAEYKSKYWVMNCPMRSVDDMEIDDIYEMIRNGKKELEQLFAGINPNYSCCAMRLTNLPWVEAPLKTIQPMVDNKIKVHSLATASSTKNNEKGYWKLNSDLHAYEIPIHSVQIPSVLMLFKFKRLRLVLYRKQYNKIPAYPNNNEHTKKNFSYLTKKIGGKTDLKWDCCKQSAKEMIKYLEVGLKNYAYAENEVPLVMIAHSKDFFNDNNLRKFLSIANNKFVTRGLVRFSSFQSFVEKYLHNS